MSLINDMLRELDRRRAGSGKTSPLAPVLSSRPAPSRRVILLILVMTIALIGVLLLVAYLLGRSEPSHQPVSQRSAYRTPAAAVTPGERTKMPQTTPVARRNDRATLPSRPVLLAVVPSPRGAATTGLWLSFSASLASVSPVRNVHSLQLRLPARLPAHLSVPPPPTGFSSLRFEKVPGGMLLLARAQAGFQLQLGLVPGAKPANSILTLQARAVTRTSSATVRSSPGGKYSRRKILPLPRVHPKSTAPAVPLPAKRHSRVPRSRHRNTAISAPRATGGGGSVSVRPQPVPATVRAQKVYNRGMKDLAAGHTAQGTAALRQALVINPKLVPARLLLAGFEARAGKLQSALSILNAGFALGTGRLSLARLKARILVTAGQIDQAIGVLERNAPTVNDDPAYHALLAGLEVRSGHYRRAAQQYAALLPLNPDKAVWWLGLAIALDQSRQKPAARKAYQSALEHPGLSPAAQAYARRRLKVLQGGKG